MFRGERPAGCRDACRRGSYFFVIDGFFASTIFLFCVLFLFAFVVSTHSSAQPASYASDYLLFLATTQVRDVQTAGIVSLIADGNITQTRITLMSQLLLFHNQSKPAAAMRLLNATITKIPSDVGINVTISPFAGSAVSLFNRTVAGMDRKQTHLVVKSVEYAVLGDSELIGPSVVTVEVWA